MAAPSRKQKRNRATNAAAGKFVLALI